MKVLETQVVGSWGVSAWVVGNDIMLKINLFKVVYNSQRTAFRQRFKLPKIALCGFKS